MTVAFSFRNKSGKTDVLFIWFIILLYFNNNYNVRTVLYVCQVKVNGEDFLEYEQRLDDRTINCIRIQNDVQLTEVKLK